jgi:hypothetical protein
MTLSRFSRPRRSLAMCAAGVLATLTLIPAASAQAPAKPVAAQGNSIFSYEVKDGQQVIAITNIAYDLVQPYVPGRKETVWLVLRITTQSKQVIDEIGMEGKVTVEAWPLGTDLTEKPRYSLSLEGAGVDTVHQSVLVFDRALEEVQWWSVHALDSGAHLFDTYVRPVEFSISREFDTPRFVGLETPPDDTKDARLKDPHVVAVLSYASAERVLRETLLTCDDPKRAEQMRSYADETRTVDYVEGPVPPAKDKAQAEPTRTLKITFSQSYPSPPNPVSVLIPVAGDDLDLAHAKLPACMHATAWKR